MLSKNTIVNQSDERSQKIVKPWAVVATQLDVRSHPTPEACSSNLVIAKFYIEHCVLPTVPEKTKVKNKEAHFSKDCETARAVKQFEVALAQLKEWSLATLTGLLFESKYWLI